MIKKYTIVGLIASFLLHVHIGAQTNDSGERLQFNEETLGSLSRNLAGAKTIVLQTSVGYSRYSVR